MKFDIKNYFNKYKLLFTKPDLFFKEELKEINYWNILLFFVFFTFILNLLIAVVGLVSGNFLIIGDLVGKTILSFIFPFILVFYMHLFILLFKGHKGYLNSFKAIVYSNSVGVVYDFFLYLISFGFVSILSDLSTDASLTSIWTYASSSAGFWFLGILFVLVGLVKLIHIIYLSVVSLNMYQGVSRKNALIAVLVAKAIIWILIGLFLLVMYLFYPPVMSPEVLSAVV